MNYIPSLWAIGFLLLYSLSAQAQIDNEQNTGLLCSDDRYQELDVLPAYSGEKYNEIPLKVSLRPYCPVAGNQTDIGSCVGWAVGYGALTISRAVQQKFKDHTEITRLAHSAAFIYNQIKLSEADCQSGAYIEDALHLLRDKGDCLQETFNFKTSNCQKLPTTEAIKEARKFKINDFATLFPIGTTANEKNAIVCKTLAAKAPIIVGLQVSPSFWEVRPGQERWRPTREEPLQGFHAMVVVGYDNIEKEFELLNSFGPGWGNQGFIKMNYEEFSKRCRYAYICSLSPLGDIVVNPERDYPKDDQLKGAFVFRRPVGYVTLSDGREAPFYEELATRFETTGNYYSLENGPQEVGDVFQLVARKIPAGNFAYVFSMGPDGKTNLHFPKVQQAGFMLSQQAEIAIPSEETVLQLSAPGSDYLCILYSSRKLPDINDLLEDFESLEGASFSDRLEAVFGHLLISPSDVKWEEDKMEFAASPDLRSGKYVAPIVLEVIAH